MYKLNSLRDYLMQHVPGLRQNPDRLHVFVDEQGSILCAAEAGQRVSGWQYQYEAKALVTDYSLHPDAFIAPVLEWVAQEQPDLLLSHAASEEGVRFESDIIADDAIDLQVTLKLSERVTMRIEDGKRVVQHHSEPPLSQHTDVADWEIYIKDELVMAWTEQPEQIEPQP